MRKAKIIRFICDILIVIFLLGFVFALFWFLCGSFEMIPTEEQQEKARIGAILLMIATGVPCSACIAVRRAYKAKSGGDDNFYCGGELILVRPSKRYEEQVMSYKEEMSQNGDSFDGCAGLEEVRTFDEWMDFERRLREKYKEGYVPSEVFLAVRQNDDRVVGIIDFRHPLSDFLKNFGGNIGYSIRPSERRKGYASKMLGLVLPICREFGESKVLVACDKENTASRRTIINNGGVLENEVADTVGLTKSGVIQRYWISI